MKLLIVGGSAHSTPQLFATLPQRMDANPLQVTLAARSQVRLLAVRDAIEAVSNVPCKISLTTLAPENLRRAASDADTVLIQARVGGYAARAHDEAFPLDCGICGDEGLGPGGLAAGWRTWPFIRDVLQNLQEAGSTPRILLLTSPLGLLVRCAKTAFPAANIVGICELPWVTLRDVIQSTRADPAQTRFEYVGVNHLGWFTSITDGTRDIIRAYSQSRDARSFPTAGLIAACEAIPLKYLRLHYDADDVVREQRATLPRAMQLEKLQEAAYEAYRTCNREQILAALMLRPAPWYEHAIVHLLAPVDEAQSAVTVFLTTTNDGYLPWLANDDVLEVPHRVTASGLERHRPVTRIPKNVRVTLDALVGYEAAAAAAISARDESALAPALDSHPWVANAETAQRLAPNISQPSNNGGDHSRIIVENTGQTVP